MNNSLNVERSSRRSVMHSWFRGVSEHPSELPQIDLRESSGRCRHSPSPSLSPRSCCRTQILRLASTRVDDCRRSFLNYRTRAMPPGIEENAPFHHLTFLPTPLFNRRLNRRSSQLLQQKTGDSVRTPRWTGISGGFKRDED